MVSFLLTYYLLLIKPFKPFICILSICGNVDDPNSLSCPYLTIHIYLYLPLPSYWIKNKFHDLDWWPPLDYEGHQPNFLFKWLTLIIGGEEGMYPFAHTLKNKLLTISHESNKWRVFSEYLYLNEYNIYW